MLAAEIWWDPIANFSAAKFRMRNRGHLLLSRPRKNRLSWFSFFISANQLRSVLLSVVSGGGFQPGCSFFLFSASRFLAAHKNCTASSHQSGKWRSVQRLWLLSVSHPSPASLGSVLGV